MSKITTEEFLILSPLNQLKYSIESSIESHKGYSTEYWRGSKYMGENILKTIELIESKIPPNQENKELRDILKKGIARTEGDGETLTIHWDALTDSEQELISDVLDKSNKG